MLVMCDQWLTAILTALKTGAAAPSLATAHIRLFTNLVTPDRTRVAGDFTEAAFTGYSAAAFGVLGPFPDSVHGPYDLSGQAVFTVGSPVVTGQSVNGYYVTDTAGNLIGAELFPSPIEMSTVGANIVQTVFLRLREFGF